MNLLKPTFRFAFALASLIVFCIAVAACARRDWPAATALLLLDISCTLTSLSLRD